MSEEKCFECGKPTTELYNVPTSSTKVMDNTTEVLVWNTLCYGCFVAYSGFDNEGRPAVVQLLEA